MHTDWTASWPLSSETLSSWCHLVSWSHKARLFCWSKKTQCGIYRTSTRCLSQASAIKAACGWWPARHSRFAWWFSRHPHRRRFSKSARHLQRYCQWADRCHSRSVQLTAATRAAWLKNPFQGLLSASWNASVHRDVFVVTIRHGSSICIL